MVVHNHAAGNELHVAHTSRTRKAASKRAAHAIASALLIAAMILPVPALAITTETEAELTETQQMVEESAAAYDEATANVEELQGQIDELQGQIDELEAQIEELEAELPEAQEAASEAMVELYRYSQSNNSTLTFLLNSESFDDFITTMKYMENIEEDNNEAVEELNELQAELEEQEALLEADKAELDAAMEEAEEEQEAAEEAQAQAEAETQAEEEVEALAAAAAENGTSTTSVDISTVDWGVDEETFVSVWGPRIDAYLEGSELAGYGDTFAAAAWTYGVDPRWSPAISCMESSKGANCFKSHNAWGWGDSSWDTWEEAIYAHVAGLARVYGYTLTVSAAQKYCPPNWYVWYNTVASEMNKI